MNPYQPPHAGQAPYQQGYGPMMPPPAERERLMRIASDQRMINFIVLAYFATSMLSTSARESAVMQLLVGVIAVGVVISGVVFAVRMASALHGTGIAILCAVLLFVPCVGLLVLLVLNSQATRELRKVGLRVGLLGADASQFQGWR
jgi:hypothetical protein